MQEWRRAAGGRAAGWAAARDPILLSFLPLLGLRAGGGDVDGGAGVPAMATPSEAQERKGFEAPSSSAPAVMLAAS
jgi:hypothetical protein